MYKKLWLIFVATMLPVWVAAQEKVEKPVETVDMVYVIIFGVLFLGSIAGFLVYMWIIDRKQKKGADSQAAG